MSHQVQKMFSVRERPWHYSLTGPEKTAILSEEDRPTDWPTARKLAGLDWDPIEETPYRKQISMDEKGNTIEEFVPVESHKWIARSDTGQVLGSAVDSYELITNSDMGDIIEAMLGDRNSMKFETGGCLDEGRKVWAMLQMGDLLEIPGDPSPTARYLALLNTHDGHGACKAIATNVRIVCANTWHYADTQADADLACFSFHHRSQWKQHLDQLREDVKAALSGAGKEVEFYREMAEEMSAMRVTPEQEERFVDEFIYPTKNEHKLKPKALENVQASREDLRVILASPTCEGIRGTAYGLMQAGGEWADHLRRFKNEETYLNRTVFSTEERKTRAKNLAELAGQGVL